MNWTRLTASMALVLAAISILLSAYLYLELRQQDGENLDSRADATRLGCQERNEEREVTRTGLLRDKAQLARVSDDVLAQFGFTRKRATREIELDIANVAELDCEKKVDAVYAEPD